MGSEYRARKSGEQYLRKTNFDSVPMKPQRVYQCMSYAFGKDVTISLSQFSTEPRRSTPRQGWRNTHDTLRT